MSVKVMGQVWELKLKPADKYVLLAYVDHADHEGNGIRPSKELIAWKTGYKIRQVQAITNKLVACGLLEIVSNDPGKVITYRATLHNAEKLPERKKGVQRLRGAKIAGVQNTTGVTGQGGAIATLKGRTEPSIEPSKNGKSKKLTKSQLAAQRISNMDNAQSVLYHVFIQQFGYQPEYDEDFETDIARLSSHGISAPQLATFIEATTKSEWWVKNRNGAAVRVKYAADNISQMAKPATPAPKSTNGTNGNLQNSARLHGLVGEVIE